MPILKVNRKTISTPLLDIIKKVRAECHNGKLSIIREMGDNIRVTCVNPEHKGGHEAKASADIYIGETNDKVEYGQYHCFTCGMICDFIHFVAVAFEESDNWAKKWLIDNFADGDAEDIIIDLPPLILTKPKKQYLDKSILDRFENFHPYMLQRKLTKDVIERFQIKYDAITECLVFPVFDERNNLVMLTRRSVKDKKFIIDKNKEKPLYLLNDIRERGITETIITEGQIDALTAQAYGYPCIATMGAISQHQLDLINKSGIRILYTMFDNDEAGQKFTNTVVRNIRKDILIVNVPILYKNKKDINDLTKEEFINCINTAKSEESGEIHCI